MTATAANASVFAVAALVVGGIVGGSFGLVAVQTERIAAIKSVMLYAKESRPSGRLIAVSKVNVDNGLPSERISYPEGLGIGVKSIVDITCSGYGEVTIEIIAATDLEDSHEGLSIAMTETDGPFLKGVHLLSSSLPEEHVRRLEASGAHAHVKDVNGKSISQVRLSSSSAARELGTFLRDDGATWLAAAAWETTNPEAARSRRFGWWEVLRLK